MLCSDGLHGMVHDQEIGKILGNGDLKLEEASAKLIEAANEAGGRVRRDGGAAAPSGIGSGRTLRMSLLEREKRVPLNLPVEVRGEDVAGVHFTEQTRSHNVSGGGICFESQRTLAVGARLQLAIELPVEPAPPLRRRRTCTGRAPSSAAWCASRARRRRAWARGSCRRTPPNRWYDSLFRTR